MLSDVPQFSHGPNVCHPIKISSNPNNTTSIYMTGGQAAILNTGLKHQ